MSTLIHWHIDAREFRYSHAPRESDRARRSRKPVYSRLIGRTATLTGFHRRRLKRAF